MVSGKTDEAGPVGLSGGPGASGDLVGRDPDVGHLVELIRSGARIVNVCGPAGVGKSALVAVAVNAISASFDEVRFADLAGAGTAGGWPAALERSLGLPAGGEDGSAALRIVLAGRTLLVLDHAEAVVSQPQLEELIAECPRLQVVVITVAWFGSEDHLVVEPLGREDAQRLFVTRAAQTVLRFVPDEDTAPYVEQICEALEGLPLALELAAARLPALSLPLLARELTERRALSVLSGPASGRVGRIGVRECLERSCAHLNASGVGLFAVSGIFEGSFSLEALIEVAGGVGTGEVFDELARLVDLRLLEQVPDDEDGVRYRLPGLVRELARHRLQAAGWFEQTGERHARFFASVARRAAEDILDALDEQGLAVLRLESGQLWAALDWLHIRRPVEALRLAADLAYLADRVGKQERCRAVVDGLLRECLAGTQAADSGAGAWVEPAAHRDALLAAGTLGLRSRSTVADTELARERLVQGTALARRLGEPLPLLWSLSQVTLAFPITGEVEPARLAAKEGIELARAVGHARWRGRFEIWLGMIGHASGESVEAARWGQLGLRRVLRSGDPRGVIAAGLLLHQLPAEAGVDRTGLPSLGELTAMAERLGDVTIRTHLYAQLAAAALAAGDLPGSARWVLARLGLVVRSTAWHGPGYVLMQAAMIACLRGDDEVAARLHGPVSPMLDVLYGGLPPPYAARYRACIAAARERAGLEVFDALVADSSPQSWDEALIVAKPYLLSVAEPAAPTKTAAEPGPTRELTPRERLVLAHLVAGRRNKEIAALLRITPKTVMHHSVAIYRKLGVRGRAEAAVLALREGLVSTD